MFIDARQIEPGSALSCDVCVVGAGAAGIPIALELDGSGLAVLVLEAGGRRFDAEALQLQRPTPEVGEGREVEHDYRHTEASKYRPPSSRESI
jgi:choline dehydrogenase-like flavoprotein